MLKKQKVSHTIIRRYFFLRGNILKTAIRIIGIITCIIFGIISIFYLSVLYLKKCVYPIKYKEIVFEYSQNYDLDKALIFAIIKTESGFNEKAISKVGAIGLMQITETTGKYIAQKLNEKTFDLKNAKTNIRFGCFYIRYLFDRFEDNKTALIAYNAGEGNVKAWLSDKNYSLDGKTLKVIPFGESREYINKIYRNFEKYKKLYKNFLDK